MNRLVLRINRDGYFQGSLGRCLERKRVTDIFFRSLVTSHLATPAADECFNSRGLGPSVCWSLFQHSVFFSKIRLFHLRCQVWISRLSPQVPVVMTGVWSSGCSVGSSQGFFFVGPTTKLYLLTLVLIFEGIFREETFLYTCPRSHEF